MPKASTKRNRRALLRAAKRAIRERYSDSELTLGDMSAATETSPRQLQRIFREEANEDFRTALLAVRMRRAISLLGQGYSSEEVASRVGYSGRSGLKLALRRYCGKTPSDFQPKSVGYLGTLEEPDEAPPLTL